MLSGQDKNEDTYISKLQREESLQSAPLHNHFFPIFSISGIVRMYSFEYLFPTNQLNQPKIPQNQSISLVIISVIHALLVGLFLIFLLALFSTPEPHVMAGLDCG